MKLTDHTKADINKLCCNFVTKTWGHYPRLHIYSGKVDLLRTVHNPIRAEVARQIPQ